MLSNLGDASALSKASALEQGAVWAGSDPTHVVSVALLNGRGLVCKEAAYKVTGRRRQRITTGTFHVCCQYMCRAFASWCFKSKKLHAIAQLPRCSSRGRPPPTYTCSRPCAATARRRAGLRRSSRPGTRAGAAKRSSSEPVANPLPFSKAPRPFTCWHQRLTSMRDLSSSHSLPGIRACRQATAKSPS